MSNFRASALQSKTVCDVDTPLARELKEKWPNIADALCGCHCESDPSLSTPPYTIMLFLEGPCLKFCITTQESRDVAFGVVQEALLGFDGLEKSLEAGQFSWRLKKGRK